MAEVTKSVGVATSQILENGVALVSLGANDEAVVTLTPQRIESLKEIFTRLSKKTPRGLVLIGPSADMFTAGADVNLIRDVKDAQTGEKLAREGQVLFDLLESIRCTKVAAISGPCVGGGCELALACDIRIISERKSSVIGLPETKLGILPGFGGTQRLPRLIGLPKALDIILAGKTLKAKKALKVGLVNEVVSADTLRERAIAIASGAAKIRTVKLPLVDRLLTFNPIGRMVVRKNAEKALRKQTKGFYPAPPAALQCALYGLAAGKQAGLLREASELGRLIATPECKALVNLFFLSEASKGLGKSARKAIEHVHGIVIGAGAMGAGIAGSLARSDCSVILKDMSDTALQRGIQQIRKSLDSLSDTERSFVMNRIEITTRDSSNYGNANFAVEAVLEEMPVKKKVLGELATLMPDDALITTNTSSLSVTEIASAIKNPERVAGMHFFNPVDKMPLVEIVRGKATSDRTLAMLAALTVKMGKFPIIVDDVPGFLVNRILSPYLNEAAFLLMDGYSIESIDKAALAFGMPMGPLRLLDEVGLDIAAHVAESMALGYPDRMQSPAIAKAMVSLGRKGKKSGGGFYDYNGKETTVWSGVREGLKIEAPVKSAGESAAITDRLILALLNEAVRCLDEGVAGTPSREAANQVDLGTVMGIGFPPFRGGILYYAESVGAKSLLDKLTALEKSCGARFKPWRGFAERVSRNSGFHSAL